MKRIFKTITGILLGLSLGGTSAGADTIISVTETHFDALKRPDCVAVRMNPATFANAPSNACSLGSQGSYGPDRISRTIYDVAGRVSEIDQAYGTSIQRAYVRYSYTTNGLKATEMDANSNLTTFQYDGFDRLSRVFYPSQYQQNVSDYGNWDGYDYDPNGNKTWFRRRNGKTISYSYDNLNREVTRSVSDGSVQTVYSGYDLQGHLLYARYGSPSGAGVTNYYDGFGRLNATTDMNGRSIWLGYRYPNEVVTALVYPDGQGVNTDDRDALNRLKTAYFGSGSTYLTVAQPSYDNLGRRAGMNRGNAVGNSWGYDNLSRLTAYNVDPAGTANDLYTSFTYSPASQLVSTSATSTNYDYKETDNTTVAKTYDGLNRDQTIDVLSNGYDANGNLTNDGTRLFYYDVYNHLTGVGSSAYPQNGPYLTFAYDPIGRLASQTYYGTTTSFLYDGTNLIGEYNASGAMTERYIHGDGVDEPLVWFHGSGTSDERFFVQDYHGSVIGYTDASGNLQTLYKYGPYGEPKNISNGTDFTGARFRYTGQTVIPEAGLYYYKARVYDPIMGRFLQTDPIGSRDNLDLYAYVGGDPVDSVDPTGTQVYVGPLTTSHTKTDEQVLGGIIVGGAVEVGCALGPCEYLAARAGLAMLNPATWIAAMRGGQALNGAFNGENPGEAAGSRVFTSTDPLVGPLANDIERAMPGSVHGVEVPMGVSGVKSSDADILMKNSDVVEVTAGGGKGKTSQIMKQLELMGGKGELMLYGPDLGKHVINGVEKLGVKVFTDPNKLIDYMKLKR